MKLRFASAVLCASFASSLPALAQDAKPDAKPKPSAEWGNTAKPGGKLPNDVKVQLVEVAGGFVDPIHVTQPKDGSGRLFVCERPGVIMIIDKNG